MSQNLDIQNPFDYEPITDRERREQLATISLRAASLQACRFMFAKPPATWEAEVDKLDDCEGFADVMADIMERAAHLTKYAEQRAAGKTHAQAAKAANKFLIQTRRLIGFSYPASIVELT